jgi:hypothetical protein
VSHSTLPVLSHSQFPQVFTHAIDHLVTRQLDSPPAPETVLDRCIRVVDEAIAACPKAEAVGRG